MNKVRKGFLYAGTIIAIIFAVAVFMSTFLADAIKEVMTIDFIRETLLESDPYASYTTAELEEIQKLAFLMLDYIGIALKVFAVVEFIIALLLLVKTCKGVYSKGLTITLLILSLPAAIISAFMIVVLCVKDKNTVPLESTLE